MAHQLFQSCIEACDTCADACDGCAIACLQEQEVSMMVRAVALSMDCAQLCRMASGYMARQSEMAGPVCQLCADVCYACGDECGKYASEHCQECAAACRRCAEECLQMARSGQGIWQGSPESMPAH
ncbi:MAG: four-helix bundle copper-binding protein [Burkholderiaceae bacterium]